MPGIVCAIRGGPSSQPTIATSIKLASETGETIHFLYVVNLDFLTHSSSSILGGWLRFYPGFGPDRHRFLT